MARRIKKGTLVCMHRRNVKGQGVVLDRVKNINEFVEFDLEEAFYKIYDKTHSKYCFNRHVDPYIYRSEITDLTSSISEEIKNRNPDIDLNLLKEFWHYNEAYSVLKNGSRIIKPKIDFCLVMWFKPPSDYSSVPYKYFRNREAWFPTKALRTL